MRNWRGWLRTLLPPCRPGQAQTPTARRAGRRPLLEVLEGRLAPATSIVVLGGAAGSGSLDHFLSPTDGTITTAGGGNVSGTLSTGTLQAVSATTDISIAAQTSITFNFEFSTLDLQTGAGHSAAFSAGSADIAFFPNSVPLTTAGASLDWAPSGDEGSLAH
jgi:hypothetical protein